MGDDLQWSFVSSAVVCHVSVLASEASPQCPRKRNVSVPQLHDVIAHASEVFFVPALCVQPFSAGSVNFSNMIYRPVHLFFLLSAL